MGNPGNVNFLSLPRRRQLLQCTFQPCIPCVDYFQFKKKPHPQGSPHFFIPWWMLNVRTVQSRSTPNLVCPEDSFFRASAVWSDSSFQKNRFRTQHPHTQQRQHCMYHSFLHTTPTIFTFLKNQQRYSQFFWFISGLLLQQNNNLKHVFITTSNRYQRHSICTLRQTFVHRDKLVQKSQELSYDVQTFRRLSDQIHNDKTLLRLSQFIGRMPWSFLVYTWKNEILSRDVAATSA